MRGALIAGIAMAAAVVGVTALPAAPAEKAAAVQDWTKVVAVTAEGGFRIGNPAAPRKLIEYGSFTCDHCAHFAEEGTPRLLDQYVKSGKLSFEYRSYVRDPADVAAALLARCAGAPGYFAVSRLYYSGQQEWFGRLQALPAERIAEINALPPAQRFAALASAAGLDAMAAKAGVPAAKAKQCLADRAALDKLAAMNKVANEQHQLEGTPTFILDGKTTQAHNWAALQPLLGPPGG